MTTLANQTHRWEKQSLNHLQINYECQSAVQCVCLKTFIGQPHSLSVDSTAATSIRICWIAPVDTNSLIMFYSINTRNLNSTDAMAGVIVVNTTTRDTFFNVTGLLPGTTYELSVVAVSQVGDIVARSEASDPVIGTTDKTG